MRMRVLAVCLALGLGGGLLGAACSQEDPGHRAGAMVEQEAETLDRAAETREPSMKAAAERVERAIEDEDGEIRIELSGRENRDKYDEVRARAKREMRDVTEQRER